MSDRMTPIPFNKLLNRCITEFEREKSIFGIPQAAFFTAQSGNKTQLFGRNLENICGPAAGPHTQLAQNIAAAYLCGSRFFELKTVQKLDGEDLPVSKPCIWAKDETYNVEWSTELLVSQAMDEYIKAWFLLHVLSRELDLGAADGFIFNMSVGYDLEGIKLPKIDTFIEGLQNASQTAIFSEAKSCLKKAVSDGILKRTDNAFIDAIPSQVCNSVTLSTLHGCPPDEIERIASYLIDKKNLHTFIKCNPTLLGYTQARSILDELGFTNLHFNSHHFEHDLQFSDAVPLIERMQTLAAKHGKTFGVKLTNTFPVHITNKELPGTEMYMSGISLLPLSLCTAQKLSHAFKGKLRISFSGGADELNIAQLCKTGMFPITLATTILKPGGYERFNQIAAKSVILANQSDSVSAEALEKLCAGLAQNTRNIRAFKSIPRVKIQKQVPLTDCFAASCKSTCPIEQDIPEYIAAAAHGKYEDALRIITAKNPLPFITGTICNHRCTTSCVRRDCDESVKIREIKLLCAQKALPALLKTVLPTHVGKVRAAIVGAGPAGLAAAFFLRRVGIAVTVFDRQTQAGGVVRSIIPPFRIASEVIDRDIEWITAHGVDFKLGTEVSPKELAGFDYTVLACGAWKGDLLSLEADKKPLACFDFLAAFNQNPAEIKLGKKIAIIGAGNSAMDACRAALRVPGVQKVSIVYRRTREEMPALAEELGEALSEGAQFLELLAPISYKGGKLVCAVCELGAPDASGRRSPIKTDKTTIVEADTVISAVGEKIDEQMLRTFGVQFENGKPLVHTDSLEIAAQNVFLIGDARRGPATIVEAISDAQKASATIIARVNKPVAIQMSSGFSDIESAQKRAEAQKHGVLQFSTQTCTDESKRCLTCNLRCGVCVEVCPNRANVLITAAQKPQIVHLDSLCNECGNCEAFCPYDSAPYLEKFTYFSSEKDFTNSTNAGFAFIPHTSNMPSIRLRLDGKESVFAYNERAHHANADMCAIIDALKNRYDYVQ